MKTPLFLIRLITRLVPSQRRDVRRVLLHSVQENGPRPWYGQGALITHYTMSWRAEMSLCARRVDGTSTEPPRTLIGVTCLRCVRLRRRALKDWLAEPGTIHERAEGRARPQGGTWRKVVACQTCTAAADGTVVDWPCSYAPDESATYAVIPDAPASA